MPKYNAKIYVTLKPSILDPQGRTVERALSHLDHKNVGSVRIGKYIELSLSGEKADVEAQLRDITENVLSNPIMEDARWEIEEEK
ncbi:phosphoribosylformylglycinamidine synthase subunit PurS [Deinococcus cavernae]|uniref:Phosphoribosylformylglycinamidine synthase subunit PurS n=1 Tax=Deinococcus cavernae TaxID=2320857 RepID=A0A418V9E3_9DEIO|nr:phosphoribosylformylglycinamidine synthase subunit PurS [Deinococcus cavernae]RJF72672.1 phosphoribosylformylglycinamidine synthase subunit PurS [Deinococcus cavernae]